jgi:nucleotide-binding universal stress UspA family protein
MKTILVPTDFSDAADNAALYAANLAKSSNAKVILFHVYHVPVSSFENYPIMPIEIDELQEENEKWLKKTAAQLEKKTGIEISYQAKMGFAGEEILEIKHADLIIMGMKGAGKLEESLLGSIAATTFRKSKVPVLLIPEGAKYKRPKTIVFACDYDPSTDIKTLEALTDFASAFDPKIYVVNIKRKKESLSIKKEMGTKLEGKLSNVEHVYYFPEKEDLAEGINEFTNDCDADIVAVIPHRYGLVDSMFHKSVSKKLAFHTSIPLLAVPDNHK